MSANSTTRPIYGVVGSGSLSGFQPTDTLILFLPEALPANSRSTDLHSTEEHDALCMVGRILPRSYFTAQNHTSHTIQVRPRSCEDLESRILFL